MAKRVEIPFNPTVNTSEFKKGIKDMQNIIKSSDLKYTDKQSADAATREIERITKNYEKMAEKGKLGAQDIQNLQAQMPKFLSNVEHLSGLYEKVGGVGFSKELKETQKELERFESEYSKFVKKVAKEEGLNIEKVFSEKELRSKISKLGVLGKKAKTEKGLTEEEENRRLALQKELADNKQLKKVLNESTEAKERQSAISKKYAEVARRTTEETKNFANSKEKANESIKKVNKNSKEMIGSTQQSGEELKKVQLNQQSLNKTMGNFNDRLLRMVSIAYLARRAYRELREATNIVREVDKAMTGIAVVTNQAVSEMWQQFEKFNTEAARLSATTREYLEGAKIFYQQGMRTAQVMEMVTATTMSARLANVSFQEASETLTAAVRAFNREASFAMDVTDKLAALGASSASNFQELSAAMTRTAAQAAAAGMDFDYMLGILAKGIETTRESAETLGTALMLRA